jgi:hypothetical protein
MADAALVKAVGSPLTCRTVVAKARLAQLRNGLQRSKQFRRACRSSNWSDLGRHVMFTVLTRGEADVASCLASDFVSEHLEGFGEINPR